jgi:Zn-dependent protease with chaperone function
VIVRSNGTRTHQVLYRLLAGAWYASMAAMFVALPVIVLVVLTSGGHPATIAWSVATMFLLILSLRVRDRAEPPGRTLSREEAPRFHELVEEARRVAGIGPVGEIRLTGTPSLGVTRVFRGGIIYTRPVKVLVVGLPYLRSLTVPELESILLHEFAHFVGQDVDRGEEMATIESRLGNLRAALDRTTLLRWGNPVYLWVRAYGWLFTVATASIRRRQELAADALAAERCGPLAYSRALLKAASVRKLFFRVAARRVVAAAKDGGPPPANVYLEFRRGIRAMSPEDRRRALREVREAPEAAHSTHPPLAARLERLGRLHVPRRRAREERASNLVPGLAAIEEEMSPAATRLVLAALVVKARRLGRSLGTAADAEPAEARPEPASAHLLEPRLALLPA